MRLRNITGSQEVIDESSYVENCPKEKKGRWQEVFGNTHPVHIEVGMGKGKFLMELSAQNSDINYIGIERYSSVLLRALQKTEQEERTNLKFLCMDAREIDEIFAPEEVERVYLNFSDPWPKERHAKRRLVSREFLARFDRILKKDGRLEFKTDNRGLFDFAVEELLPAGYRAEQITYDLHHDAEMMRGNVMTEYEEKFSCAGHPICKYIISR